MSGEDVGISMPTLTVRLHVCPAPADIETVAAFVLEVVMVELQR